MKSQNFAEPIFKTLMHNNTCFKGSARTTPFETINLAFPCGALESPHNRKTFEPQVMALLTQVYSQDEISRFDALFKIATNMVLSFVCTFIRNTIDAFMRKFFQLDPTFAPRQVLPLFNNSCGTSSLSCCRISEKSNGRRYNVFVGHTTPFDSDVAHQHVVLVQQVRDSLPLDQLSADLQLMYCFVPAG
jgi:hypothetical protein